LSGRWNWFWQPGEIQTYISGSTDYLRSYFIYFLRLLENSNEHSLLSYLLLLRIASYCGRLTYYNTIYKSDLWDLQLCTERNNRTPHYFTQLLHHFQHVCCFQITYKRNSNAGSAIIHIRNCTCKVQRRP
jgi:hypothetical protein